ncbi:MAG TPA: hypothetical protein VH678_03790 [Xanthobacteraceae bacterium]|jgi:hypothetical protein
MSLGWSTLAEIRDLWLPPRLRRRFALVSSFLGFGLIAGASGLSLIAADDDSNPRSAFAFAPLETANVGTAAANANAQVRAVETALAPEAARSDSTTREIGKRESFNSCMPSSAHGAANRCAVSVTASNPEAHDAASDPPPSTAVPGSSDSHAGGSPAPVLAHAEPPAPAVTTPVVELSQPKTADALPAAVEPPVAETPAPKPRRTARQQNGYRHAYQQSARHGRYAQQHFWPFW